MPIKTLYTSWQRSDEAENSDSSNQRMIALHENGLWEVVHEDIRQSVITEPVPVSIETSIIKLLHEEFKTDYYQEFCKINEINPEEKRPFLLSQMQNYSAFLTAKGQVSTDTDRMHVINYFNTIKELPKKMPYFMAVA